MCVIIFFKFYFIFKLYNIVLVLPNIEMNPPQVYMCSPSWTLLRPPSPYHLWVIPVHQPQASSIVHQTWTGDSFHKWYYTYFNAILPNHPSLSLSQTPKDSSIGLLLNGELYQLWSQHKIAAHSNWENEKSWTKDELTKVWEEFKHQQRISIWVLHMNYPETCHI